MVAAAVLRPMEPLEAKVIVGSGTSRELEPAASAAQGARREKTVRLYGDSGEVAAR